MLDVGVEVLGPSMILTDRASQIIDLHLHLDLAKSRIQELAYSRMLALPS